MLSADKILLCIVKLLSLYNYNLMIFAVEVSSGR